MDEERKNEIYKELISKYYRPCVSKQESKILDILNELATQNTRSLVILGCAYLEELCKECVLATMTKEGKKEYIKRHNRELTFSFASTFLYAQNYISLEIFQILNQIRDIRNKYAHEPVIDENLMKSIKSKTESLRDSLKNRWLTLDTKRILKLSDSDDQLYFIVFENLFIGFLALELFISPYDKIVKLKFIPNQTNLKIHINASLINENTLKNFKIKFGK